MSTESPPLVLAVPELTHYQRHTGIGRVFHSLLDCWQERVRPVDAALRTYPVPIVRNFPYRVDVPAGANLVFFPRLTGARALRDTQGYPGIVVMHDIGTVDYPAVDKPAMDTLTYLSILHSFYGIRQADCIIAVSEFTRERLARRLPEVAERTVVVHSGVDPVFLQHHGQQEQARQELQQTLGQAFGSPLLVYVGSEVPRKNIALLLQVFKQIKQRYPGAQLLKVGGPGQPRWRVQTQQTMAELQLREGADILFSSSIDDNGLANAYCAADLFVSTSLYEGFGLPPLEAMAVGTPVVVSNRGSFPEVVGEAGRVVEPEPDAFVEAIEQALTDPHGDSRRRSGQARAATFTWHRAAERYLEIMHQVSRPAP